MLPKDIVIVSIDFKELLVAICICLRGKYPLEVTGSAEFLLGLEEDVPVFRTEQLKTVIIVELF
jgi:hypothetical protein